MLFNKLIKAGLFLKIDLKAPSEIALKYLSCY